EARRRAEEEARRRAPQVAPRVADDEEEEGSRGRGVPPRRGVVAEKPEAPRPAARPKGAGERRRGKLTLTSALSGDEGRGRSLSSMRRRQEKFKRAQVQEPREKIAREVTLPETI